MIIFDYLMSQIRCSFCDHVIPRNEYALTLYSSDDNVEIRICDQCSDDIIDEVLNVEEDTEPSKMT